MRFRDTPIRRKLTMMILGTSSIVVLLTCLTFFGYEWHTYRQTAVHDLATLGDVIAAQSTAAVAFDNQRDATEVLGALQAERSIVAACLYDKQGRLFAHYPVSAQDDFFPRAPRRAGYQFEHGALVGFTPLVQVRGSDVLGTLYLRSDMRAMYDRLRLYGIVAVVVMLLSSVLGYFLSRVLQRQLSRPILALADTARAVSVGRDYSVRAAKHGNDELGLLTDAFNHMLAEIGEQNANLERRVRERTAELEAANNELEAFCSSAAHDLRTPLRVITGFTDVLLDERAAALPPEVRRHVCSIRAGSEQMSQLITDLLSFSRVGRQDLTKEPVDLNLACQEALSQFEAELAGRAVEIRVGPLPTVEADPALLRVVMVNLISNALKYSRSRQPALIEIGTLAPATEAAVTVFVRDNGVGFAMKDAGKLFGVFQRLHHSREFEGTGVGLATVRRVIERHGGRIWAEAAPDAGATFFFTLPPA